MLQNWSIPAQAHKSPESRLPVQSRTEHGKREAPTCRMQLTSDASSRTCASPTGLSLLLAASSAFLLALARDDLAQHDHTVAVHEGDTREALTILEGIAHEWLLRLEAALRHLVGLERVRVLHLFTASLLAHLPLQLADPARRAAATHETDRRVTNLDLVRNVEHLDLRVELPGLPPCTLR